MRKRLRVIGYTLSIGVVIAAVLLFAALQAAQSVPTFYQQATAGDEAKQRQAADEFGTRATALYSDAQSSGQWHALFTAEQINSWLAVDLPEKHPDLLSDAVQQPRVAIAPGQLTLGFRTLRDGRPIVISIDVGLSLTETDVVACRILRARAGLLPLPLKQVLDEVTRVAQSNSVPIRWEQAGGDPVAIIDISQQADADELALQVERIELRDGEVYIAGKTAADSASIAGIDGQAPSKVKVQR